MEAADRRIVRKRPRDYWEYARIAFVPGEVFACTADHSPCTVKSPIAASAGRSVRKDGRPLGPWLFHLPGAACGYYFDPSKEFRDGRWVTRPKAPS